jgi:hypothetical protein
MALTAAPTTIATSLGRHDQLLNSHNIAMSRTTGVFVLFLKVSKL